MKREIQVEMAKIGNTKPIAELHKRVVREINIAFYPPEAIKEWLDSISEENIKQQFSSSEWIVVKIGETLVGFGQYSIKDEEVYQINVSPDYQNQRIGKAIYAFIPLRRKPRT